MGIWGLVGGGGGGGEERVNTLFKLWTFYFTGQLSNLAQLNISI